MGKLHLVKTSPRLNFDHLLQFLIATEKRSSLWRSWPWFHSPTSANEVARILAKAHSPQTWSWRVDQHWTNSTRQPTVTRNKENLEIQARPMLTLFCGMKILSSTNLEVYKVLVPGGGTTLCEGHISLVLVVLVAKALRLRVWWSESTARLAKPIPKWRDFQNPILADRNAEVFWTAPGRHVRGMSGRSRCEAGGRSAKGYNKAHRGLANAIPRRTWWSRWWQVARLAKWGCMYKDPSHSHESPIADLSLPELY